MISDLDGAAVEYLTIRRALGFKLRGHDRLLSDFIGFFAGSGATGITTGLAVSWATQPAGVQPVRHAQRLTVARGFCTYLHALDTDVEIPPTHALSCRRERAVPYLFTQADIDALVTANGLLRPAHRTSTYRAVFGLLAVTGMRVSEVLSLDRDDVNLDTAIVSIRNTKFGKHRDLPIHPTACAALQDYAAARDHTFPRRRSESFFVSTRGTPVIYACVHTVFAQLIGITGIAAPAGVERPRIHGLRHSYAVATLRDWYLDGADVMAKLPTLSAYLGHVDPISTYWYLTAAPDLLALAAQRLETTTGQRR